MAKNELGLDFSDSFSGGVLIDTETGSVIKQNAEPKKDEDDDAKLEHEDDNKLIEIPDESKSGDAVEEDMSENGDDNPGSDNDSSSLPQFNVLVKALHEKGIISDLDEELLNSKDKEEADKLFEIIKKEIEKNTSAKFEEKIKELPDKIKELINEGGTKEKVAGDLMQIQQTKESLSAIKDDDIAENEELQKNIIIEALKQRGYSDDKIKKRVSQFEDLGALEEEAKDSLKEIISGLENQEKTLIKEAEEKDKLIAKQREEEINKIKKEIFDADSIIPDVKLTEKEKEKIFDSMTKVVDKDDNGRPLNAVMATRKKNPIAFEKALHYYHALGLFNIDEDGNFKPDLSKIKTTAKASAVEELNKALKKEQRTQTGRPARESRMDRDALKKQIERMKKSLPL